MKYIILLFCFLFTIQTKAQPSFIKDSLLSFIHHGMQEWKVPGLSIVIVKDGKVVLMQGFGVRDTASGKPVDENTLFMIASNTKLFTGTALAHLETRGRLSLNDRIIKFFPQFKLFNDTVTKMVTIRDMLTHRIGTKTFQGDFTFWNTNISRTEIMRRMRYLKPSRIFRQDYG
ncbi:MAG: beta-lactamase family protein, partial [Flavisolibacter sp.]|nr:beta-lactamase family protein [Flavisolibacter sp.]